MSHHQLGLQAPDEAGRGFPERVDGVEGIGETGGVRVIHRLAECCNVELREVELHLPSLPSRNRRPHAAERRLSVRPAFATLT